MGAAANNERARSDRHTGNNRFANQEGRNNRKAVLQQFQKLGLVNDMPTCWPIHSLPSPLSTASRAPVENVVVETRKRARRPYVDEAVVVLFLPVTPVHIHNAISATGEKASLVLPR